MDGWRRGKGHAVRSARLIDPLWVYLYQDYISCLVLVLSWNRMNRVLQTEAQNEAFTEAKRTATHLNVKKKPTNNPHYLLLLPSRTILL